MKKKKVIISGGSGYIAGELLSILLLHKYVEVIQVTSHTNAGRFIYDIHPRLKGFCKVPDFLDSLSLRIFGRCHL